jgi:hypothetical protein
MTTLKLLATTLLVASLAATPLTTLAGNGKGNGGGGGRPDTPGAAASATVLEPLDENEIATLLWMREEEKLARDVYITMTGKYTDKVFSNIAAAEQKHFDAIGRKLELYGIKDVALPDIGQFYDQDLQQMYDDFVAQGLEDYVEALYVGVAIEEADMVDLTVAIDGTDSRPLKKTYSHLLIGSQHHLDSFIKLLEKEGIDYEP